jgi:hypothetical protein
MKEPGDQCNVVFAKFVTDTCMGGHIIICLLISITGFLISIGKERVYKEGGMKGWELRKDISWSMPELTLTPLHSWL